MGLKNLSDVELKKFFEKLYGSYDVGERNLGTPEAIRGVWNNAEEFLDRGFGSAWKGQITEYRREIDNIKGAKKPERLYDSERGYDRKTSIWDMSGPMLIFIVGLFFFSPNITGNVISNLSFNTTNIIGIVLLVLGSLGVFFSLKNRAKNSKS
jgi:hypothetical protein